MEQTRTKSVQHVSRIWDPLQFSNKFSSLISCQRESITRVKFKHTRRNATQWTRNQPLTMLSSGVVWWTAKRSLRRRWSTRFDGISPQEVVGVAVGSARCIRQITTINHHQRRGGGVLGGGKPQNGDEFSCWHFGMEFVLSSLGWFISVRSFFWNFQNNPSSTSRKGHRRWWMNREECVFFFGLTNPLKSVRKSWICG